MFQHEISLKVIKFRSYKEVQKAFNTLSNWVLFNLLTSVLLYLFRPKKQLKLRTHYS